MLYVFIVKSGMKYAIRYQNHTSLIASKSLLFFGFKSRIEQNEQNLDFFD
jgi:hypothetical protein